MPQTLNPKLYACQTKPSLRSPSQLTAFFACRPTGARAKLVYAASGSPLLDDTVSGLWVYGLGFMGLGFMGLGFMGLGFMFMGLGFMGLGFMDHGFRV